MFSGFSGTALPALRDDFVRANGGLGSAWGTGAFNVLAIDTNQAAPVVGGENSQWWVGDCGPDIGISFKITVFASTDYGHYVYVWNGNAGYQIYILNSGANCEIYQYTSLLLASRPLGQTFAVNDLMGTRITKVPSGNRIRVYRMAAADSTWSVCLLDWIDTAAPIPGPFYGGLGFYGTATGRSDEFRYEQVVGEQFLRQAMVAR